MASLIGHLSKKEQKELLEDIFYLNMAEYKKVCDQLKVPRAICIELPSGKIKKTSDQDRKGVILQRLILFLKTGKQPVPTILSRKIVKAERLATPTASTVLYYGQYDKKNADLLNVLKKLTEGKFRDGSIAREVLRDFYSRGKAPKLSAFAKAWIKATEEPKSHPEWAFLSDRAKGTADQDWKQVRNARAKKVLQQLSKVKPSF